MAQIVKDLPQMQETWVRSPGREDPLEKGMASTPVFLPGEIHGQRSLACYSPWRCKHDWATNTGLRLVRIISTCPIRFQKHLCSHRNLWEVVSLRGMWSWQFSRDWDLPCTPGGIWTRFPKCLTSIDSQQLCVLGRKTQTTSASVSSASLQLALSLNRLVILQT